MNPQPPSSPSSGSPNPPSGSSSAPAPSGTPAVNSTTPATGAATPSSSPNPAPVVTVTNVVTATPVPTVSSTPNNPGTKPESVGYKVVVGGPGGKFSFQPSSLKANPGDSIIFEFQQNNHTVTASSFAQPCEPLSETSTSGEAGFDSGL
jgi:plastocyanin